MIAATAAIAAAFIVILVTGGGAPDIDPTGDVSYIEGNQPRRLGAPIAASMADIATADVRRDDSDIVFEVTSAAPIPTKLKRSSLEFRFDISEDGRKAWILSATINVAPTAALVSQTSDYTGTTIDGSLPGEVVISGRSLTITLDPRRVEGFPESFEWTLSSNLIAFRDITGSTRVEDRYPDDGSVGF